MIPQFPKLKKIELSDYKAIEEVTSVFSPYNDFEFTSLWTYDTKAMNKIALLNNNLVVKIQDFITGDMFYSFIGNTKVVETATILIDTSEKEGLEKKLFLVPEITVKSDENLGKKFKIENDLDNSDYILSVDEIAELKGNKYYDKRNLVNRFQKKYPSHKVIKLDLESDSTKKELIDLFLEWEKNKGKKREETEIELIAIKKLLELLNILQIYCLGVYVDQKLIGFTTYHMVNKDYAIMSFEKGDTKYAGIFSYLNHITAMHLQQLGCKYINYEQDLGIAGLKKAKQLWRPIFFLNKYTVTQI